MIETPTTGLVIDMMRKIASFCIGLRDSMSIKPCASRCAMRPWRATSVTAPEKVPASMWRLINSVMRCRRSAGEADFFGTRRRRGGHDRPGEHGAEQKDEGNVSGGRMTKVSHMQSPRDAMIR